jgi:sirohydrochlorin cobaltochelatase
MKKVARALVITAMLLVLPALSSQAHDTERQGKTAIVIAGFGTTVPRGVVAITNINERVRKAFPQTEVRVTFTSNIIRSVWRKRQAEAQKWLDQGIPHEILYVKNIISTIGDLHEEGYRNIIVQPTHMFYMEQSYDLDSFVRALGSIDTMKARWRPFDNVVMGRPALGMPGVLYDYHDDVAAAVRTFAADAELAKREDAILLYMGHGNEHWSTGIYAETQREMRQTYPEVDTFIGVVEGHPSLEDLLGQIGVAGKKKIILKPFMIVAGDHAVNDMAGEDEDSWKSVLEKSGYEIDPVLEGLGSNDGFADIFVDHIRDVARDYNLKLQ